jgi:PKD domain/Malectin domain
MKTRNVLIAGLAIAMSLIAVPAMGAAPGHDKIPTAVPSTVSPAVNDGQVNAIVQVGNSTSGTMVIGGSFTKVTPPGGAATARSRVASFNPSTGALRALNPVLNGDVQDVLEGPVDGTVYIAGSFTTVNGAAKSHLVLLNATTGALVSGFTATTTNGVINSITRAGDRLLLGGNFTTAGGQAHKGLAAVSATTGTIDHSFMALDVTEHHNTGDGAVGAVGVRELEATPDGTKMVAIGNFRKVEDQDRDQAVVIDLNGATAAVDSWRTHRYEPLCFNFAFDTYMRGLSVSPDGKFFVITATGGQNDGTLCDTAARFEFGSAGDDVQPTWIDYAGGDTLWGVEITEQAVFVGGHQRWMNNSEASDFAGPGAVPRPGLSALDRESGLPLAWNPGRLPRGAAVFALYATPAGLWLGSDTDYIGNFKYKRPRLAFFPLAGGAQQAPDQVATLPGNVYLGGPRTVDQGNVLYRVNAGGGQIDAVDGGPAWTSDEGGSSPYHAGDANTGNWGPGATSDSTVPASTPNSVFDTELWSPSDDSPMTWTFPVTPGKHLEARLFFANRYDGTSQPGKRVFNVSVEGQDLNNFDIVDSVGDQTGTMKKFDFTSDAEVNINFSHVTENPLINAIEIVDTDLPAPAPPASTLSTVAFDGTAAGAATDVPGARDIPWANVRGAFLLGSTLFYGKTDGYLYKRTFTTSTTGAETKIDPYNDPVWVDASDGVGGTERGALPTFYGQISNLSGMFYSDDRVYYTLSGDGNLYWRWFNADSGIIGSQVFTAPGGAGWGDSGGLFKDGNTLYVVSKSTGALFKVPFSNGQPTGGPTSVDATQDWRAKAVFIGPGGTPANQPPTAAFTETHSGRTYTVNGSTSSDPDGNATITSYEWTFGDSTTATGATPAPHTYTADGARTITLKVTDDHGVSSTKSMNVDVAAAPASTISFVGERQVTVKSKTPQVTIPSVAVGDQLVLIASYAISGAQPSKPAGWTLASSRITSAVESYAWTKKAVAGDSGRSVSTPLASVAANSTLTLAAYHNVAATGGVAAISSTTDAGIASHTSPSVTAPAGGLVVQLWTDKSSTTTLWTPPSGVTTRGTSYGTGSGRTSGLLVDSVGPVMGGPAGGGTATTNATSGRAVNWTVALKPGP